MSGDLIAWASQRVKTCLAKGGVLRCQTRHYLLFRDKSNFRSNISLPFLLTAVESHIFNQFLSLVTNGIHIRGSDVKNLDVDGCGWMKLDDVGCGWISTSIHLHLLIYTLLAFLVVQRACISF